MTSDPLYISKQQLLEAMSKGRRLDGARYAQFKHKGNSRAWLMPFSPPIQRDDDATDRGNLEGELPWADEFLHATRAAFLRANQEAGSLNEGWPRLKNSVLADALSEAAAKLANVHGENSKSLELLNTRRGLQLSHVEIVQDENRDERPLDLSNGDFAFSLRLIGCVIRAPIALSNLSLVTLDLSGSALAGVDGSFLRARGSVRLRQCISSGPVDFTGAEIHGYFDASNALIHPFGPLPAGQAVSGDRGMLNLSQAHISNEVRLSTATILGGLSMRGLKTERSIFLQRAVLLSPLAVLEQVLFANKSRTRALNLSSPGHARGSLNVLDLWPTPRVFKDPKNPSGSYCLKKYVGDEGRQICLDVLMKESLRVRTSALRADGIKIAGSIFGQSLKGWGRLRLKYGEVAGSLSLEGSDLRSAESLLISFEEVGSPKDLENVKKSGFCEELCRYRAATYRLITDGNRDVLAPGADDFALDLRESRFGGAVRIGSPDNSNGQASPEPYSSINGVVSLERANIHSDLVLDHVSFKWECRLTEEHRSLADPISGQKAEKFAEAVRISNDHRDLEVEKGRCFNIEATGLETGGNISLLHSKGLNGINLAEAEIGGDLAFFDEMRRKDTSVRPKQTLIELNCAAIGLKGRLQLAGAKIGGDCKILFRHDHGPHIKARRLEVAGALAIGRNPADTLASEPAPHISSKGSAADKSRPFAWLARFAGWVRLQVADFLGKPKNQIDQSGPKDTVTNTNNNPSLSRPDNLSYPALITRIRSELKDLQYVAGFGPDKWAEFRFAKPPYHFKGEKAYQIDLGNARAAFLHHPWNAWPTTGHLTIAGFQYERALEYGPLAPGIFEENLRSAFFWSLLASFIFTVVLFVLSVSFAYPQLSIPLVNSFEMGQFERTTLATFFCGAFLYRLIRFLSRPNKFDTRPMALEWLSLQAVDRNVYRSNLTFWRAPLALSEQLLTSLASREVPQEAVPASFNRPVPVRRFGRSIFYAGHIYHSLEPYSVAVKALRESGRWISANLVEEERLRVRDDQLSWRSHLIQKSLFRLIQLLNNYGFNLSRPLFWVGVLVCCSAVLTYQAAVNGAITPKVMQVDTGSRPPQPLRPPEKVTCTYACQPVPEGLNTLVFSIDQVVPLVDLGQNSNWEVNKTIAPRWAPPWLSFEILFFFIRIIGFAMVGLLILAFSSRISLVHQRYSD